MSRVVPSSHPTRTSVDVGNRTYSEAFSSVLVELRSGTAWGWISAAEARRHSPVLQ
jgi:hypothetical protein